MVIASCALTLILAPGGLLLSSGLSSAVERATPRHTAKETARHTAKETARHTGKEAARKSTTKAKEEVGPHPAIPGNLFDPRAKVHHIATTGLTDYRGTKPDLPQPWKPRSTLQHLTKVTSTNWSAYVDVGSGFSAVSGKWTVPEPRPSSALATVSTWVGVGGGVPSTHSLIQTGTQVTTDAGAGTSTAWIELIKTGATEGNFTLTPVRYPVHPGDRMVALVEEVRSGMWHVAIEDTTQGWLAETTFPVTFLSGKTAEWVTERPYNATTDSLTTLADFGTTRFHDLSVNAGAITVTLDADVMHATTGLLLAAPTPLSVTTTGSFTNVFVNYFQVRF